MKLLTTSFLILWASYPVALGDTVSVKRSRGDLIALASLSLTFSSRYLLLQLAECFDCVELFPDAVQCLLSTETCDITACDWSGDTPDFEVCGCLSCVTPVVNCFLDCIPPCLDTAVNEYITCLTNPENNCYDSCIGYLGVGNAVTFPPLDVPTDCDLMNVFTDFSSCLPQFPTCDSVQEDALPSICEATCCSACHEEQTAITGCFYNWLSGYDCSFTCPSGRRALDENSDVSTRKLEDEPEFVEKCREKLATDIIFQPDASFNDYMECILSNSMELAADKSNKPVALVDDGPGATSSAPSQFMLAFPAFVVTWLVHLI